MTRRVPFGLVANMDARRRARPSGVRSLTLESLETRQAFCTDLTELAALSNPAALADQGEGEFESAPFYGPMTVEYYAQFPELPAQFPVISPAGAATSDSVVVPAVVDAALNTLNDPTSEGEGEDGAKYDSTYATSRGRPPRITEFDFKPSFFGGIIVYGQVEDDDGPISTLAVAFQGSLNGRSTLTNRDGYFFLFIPKNELPRGLAQAQVTDINGNKSEVIERYID